MKKIEISNISLANISDGAMREFQKTSTFGGLTQQQTQAFLYTKAIEGFLKGKGIDVEFDYEFTGKRNQKIYKEKS